METDSHVFAATGHSCAAGEQAPAMPSSTSPAFRKRKLSGATWFPASKISCSGLSESSDLRSCMEDEAVRGLFLELQDQVHAVIDRKRAAWRKEREESARIAAQHPLTFPSSTSPASTTQPSVPASFAAPIPTATPTFPLVVADMWQQSKKPIRPLPTPLSEVMMMHAYSELQSGAAMSIRSCIACWRECRLTDSDLISTIKSFSRSSPTLTKAFEGENKKQEIDDCSCVASLEDMLALAKLSQMSSPCESSGSFNRSRKMQIA